MFMRMISVILDDLKVIGRMMQDGVNIEKVSKSIVRRSEPRFIDPQVLEMQGLLDVSIGEA